MFKIFKSRETKAVISASVAFLLIFSVMVNLVSASTPEIAMEDVEATVNANEPIAVPPRQPSSSSANDANLEEGLREALVAVKKYFEIDENIFTVFSWYHSPGDGQINPDSWHLTWNSSDWSANINAQITSGGILLNYHKSQWTSESNLRNIRLAAISKSRARRIAEDFLKKVLGSEAENFRLAEQSLGFPSDRHRLSYVLTHNRFDYPNYTVMVETDKLTGEIVGYYRGGHQFFFDLSQNHFEYQDSSKTISRREALASYLDKIGLDLVYTSYFDWQTRELKVQPVYRLNNNYNEFISAADGSLVTIDFNIQPLTMDVAGVSTAEQRAAMSIDDAAESEISFSLAEQAAIDNAGNYITAEKAVEAVIEAFDLDLKDLSDYQVNTHLRADSINQKQYIWNITISRRSSSVREWYSATVDARNGDILSFSQDYTIFNEVVTEADDGTRIVRGYVEPELIYTYDEAKDIVLKKINEISPYDLDENFEFIEGFNDRRITPLSSRIELEISLNADPGKSAYYYFSFIRTVNGIKFENNSINVGFNNMTGVISNYGLTWYEDAQFPALDNIITPAKALDSIADFAGYSIIYTSNGMTDGGKINVSLIYRFVNPVNVDPFTGKWIDWRFEEMTKAAVSLPNYRDLDGHWSKEIVDTLTANDIFVWGGDKFEPDKGITSNELIDYLKFYTNNFWVFSEIDSSIFINPRAFIRGRNENSGAREPDKVITKQEAMKIICEIAGYGEIGSHYDIFAYPFDDAGSDAQYRGYIAIMKALGVIQGDGNGNFNAKSILTRAEAAAIVYNIVKAFQ